VSLKKHNEDQGAKRAIYHINSQGQTRIINVIAIKKLFLAIQKTSIKTT
jgi:hypothetical protein